MAATNHSLLSAASRISALFTIDPETDGCWNWTGAMSGGNYPGFTDDAGNFIYAHRFAYEAEYGEIPAHWHCHHLCGNRMCIRPDHLEALSPEDHRALHAAEFRAIRVTRGRVYQRLRDLGMAAREIACLVGSSANTVRRLIRDAQSVGELQAVTA
jgi:hypothetical protein